MSARLQRRIDSLARDDVRYEIAKTIRRGSARFKHPMLLLCFMSVLVNLRLR